MTGERQVVVVLAGQEGVGKSALMLRAADDVFTEGVIGTLGVNMKIWHTAVHGHHVKAVLREAPPLPTRAPHAPFGEHHAHARVVVLDMTSRSSLAVAAEWLQLAQDTGMPAVALLGNKSDERHTEVDAAEAQALAQQHGAAFHAVSAKSGAGVRSALDSVVAAVLTQQQQQQQHAAAPQQLQDKGECCLQ